MNNHASNCPVMLSEKGQWHSTASPQCLCNAQIGSTMSNESITSGTSGCDHWYRFLDFLGIKKDEGTFYCQKCLRVKVKKLEHDFRD